MKNDDKKQEKNMTKLKKSFEQLANVYTQSDVKFSENKTQANYTILPIKHLTNEVFWRKKMLQIKMKRRFSIRMICKT